MKYLLFISGLLFYMPINGQDKNTKLIGNYHDHFGNEITINADSTFKYRWHFDLASSWSNGKWTEKNDTIFFRPILVYDILKTTNADGNLIDSLVIAENEKPTRITSALSTLNLLSSGGQNRQPCPIKLFYNDNKLYGISSHGKLITKKQRGFWVNKDFDPMYFKQD